MIEALESLSPAILLAAVVASALQAGTYYAWASGVMLATVVALDADPSALPTARGVFEAPWVRWNVVRALTSTGAVGCLAWALSR